MIEYFESHEKFHLKNGEPLQSAHLCGIAQKQSRGSGHQNILEQAMNDYMIAKMYLKVVIGDVTETINIDEMKQLSTELNPRNQEGLLNESNQSNKLEEVIAKNQD